jgi:hypothetical protein
MTYNDFDKSLLPNIEKLISSNPDIQVKFIDKIEEVFLFRLREFAPKKTGRYSRSWATLEKDFKHIKFGTSMPDLYVILEFGVGPFEILPNTKKVLRFVDSAGNVVFTMHVSHPGIRPRPHARTAYDDTLRDAISILYEIIREMFPFLK